MIYLHLARTSMWHRNKVYWACYAWEDERDVVRQLYSNLPKRTQSRLVARIIKATITIIKDLIQAYLADRRQHSQTHTRTK